MQDVEMAKKLNALNAKTAELLQKLKTASGNDAKILMDRISEIGDECARIMGLSDAEIAEINRVSKSETRFQIQSEVRIGLALFERALLGDEIAIAQLRRGSLEFTAAIAEEAISADDLKKLPLAAAFVAAGLKAASTKH